MMPDRKMTMFQGAVVVMNMSMAIVPQGKDLVVKVHLK